MPIDVEDRLRHSYHTEINEDDLPLSAAEITARGANTDAILCTIGDPLNADVISGLSSHLRILANFGVGYDSIDVEAASRCGVTVTNTPGVLTDDTADIALLLMLGAARRASEGDRLIRSGSWHGWAPTHLLGTRLGGKRLGIVGMGRIGHAVARRADALGMRIHYFARGGRAIEALPEATAHAGLASLFACSDVLSLHAPSTPETRQLLNRASIETLPEGAIVVNTARGDLIDDDALIEALSSGRIAAAGLDVFDNEPAIHPGYAALPNTFLLPHLGSATRETRLAMGMCAADNLDAFFSGQVPPNAIFATGISL